MITQEQNQEWLDNDMPFAIEYMRIEERTKEEIELKGNAIRVFMKQTVEAIDFDGNTVNPYIEGSQKHKLLTKS